MATTRTPLRIGIIGSGFAGKFHLRNLRGLPAVAVGVTSPRASSREAFAAEFGVHAYASVEEMLPDIDVLDICTPPSSHAAYIRMAAAARRHVIVEKPFHGFFGSPTQHSKEEMLAAVTRELREIRRLVSESQILLGYAENIVYAPAVQRERQLVETSKAQILRMTAEESHSGSHSPVYGIWSEQGGGSLIGKGCHPLGGVLYLKRKEGLARNGRPIRPASVSCRTHAITKLPAFEDRGYLRTTYKDTEDYALLHVVFEDGTIADVMTSELVLGGVYDFVEVFANNHRTRCHIQPVKVVDLYSPDKKEFPGVDLMEKISSNEGWIPAWPEFGWSNGQFHEMRDFVYSILEGRQPECDLEVAIDTTMTIYAGYLSADRKGAEVEVPRI
ncbi:MAG TPA: Gfo/Idh/MocA family oxidoreductase [Bryobacteraceae bacterium]|nr:Gfo/Idh/MocA family oxidoreductase [Bryobacteraceae bacterium]